MSPGRAPLHLLHPSGPPGPADAVPPGAVDLPPAAVEAAARGTRSTLATARRLFLWGWVAGCAAIVVCFVLAPLMGDAPLSGLTLFGVLVMPACGFGLACVALAERRRESALALLVAGLSLAAAVSLVPAARGIGIELYVAAHQVELDALAVEIRAAYAGASAAPDPTHALDHRVAERFRGRLNALGLHGVERTAGGLLFPTPFGSHRLLYADGAGAPSDGCTTPRLRALGGRWFERWCEERKGWMD